MFEILDRHTNLTGNQKKIIAAAVIGDALEFFDYFLIGFVLAFTVLGCLFMASFGLIAGIWAEKFDQLAAFQNFLIMPLTFLSGVFYSINSLPPFWKAVSHANPVFYMIDGFRYGFFGVSDASPWLSLSVVGGFALAVSAVAFRILQSGWKLRS